MFPLRGNLAVEKSRMGLRLPQPKTFRTDPADTTSEIYLALVPTAGSFIWT